MSVLYIIVRVRGKLIDVELLRNSSAGIRKRVHGSSECVHQWFVFGVNAVVKVSVFTQVVGISIESVTLSCVQQ